MEGKGQAAPAQGQGFELLGRPAELVNGGSSSLQWAAFHCCLNQGMG